MAVARRDMALHQLREKRLWMVLDQTSCSLECFGEYDPGLRIWTKLPAAPKPHRFKKEGRRARRARARQASRVASAETRLREETPGRWGPVRQGMNPTLRQQY